MFFGSSHGISKIPCSAPGSLLHLFLSPCMWHFYTRNQAGTQGEEGTAARKSYRQKRLGMGGRTGRPMTAASLHESFSAISMIIGAGPIYLTSDSLLGGGRRRVPDQSGSFLSSTCQVGGVHSILQEVPPPPLDHRHAYYSPPSWRQQLPQPGAAAQVLVEVSGNACRLVYTQVT